MLSLTPVPVKTGFLTQAGIGTSQGNASLDVLKREMQKFVLIRCAIKVFCTAFLHHVSLAGQLGPQSQTGWIVQNSSSHQHIAPTKMHGRAQPKEKGRHPGSGNSSVAVLPPAPSMKQMEETWIHGFPTLEYLGYLPKMERHQGIGHVMILPMFVEYDLEF